MSSRSGEASCELLYSVFLLVTLLVEYINHYNINNAVNANHLQLLSMNRDEAIHRNRINYEVRNHNNDDNDNDDDELAKDEIDGGAAAFQTSTRIKLMLLLPQAAAYRTMTSANNSLTMSHEYVSYTITIRLFFCGLQSIIVTH